MLPAGQVRIYLACGFTDMRKGFHSLAAQVQTTLQHDPYSGALYIFRGRRGDLVKGVVSLTMAQLSMLLESIDWRATAWTARPELVV